MKRVYDLDYHVERLEKMLQNKGACNMCPAYQHFDVERNPLRIVAEYSIRWQGEHVKKEICILCREFVGVNSTHGCPCKVLGAKKAIKRTEEAIDNYYWRRRGQ